MRAKRTVALTAATLGLGLVFAAPAGAGQAPTGPPIEIDPTSGPSGTSITVTGGGCSDEVVEFEVLVTLTDPTFEPLATDLVSPDSEGDWQAKLIVPDGVDPDVAYFVHATCRFADDDETEEEYNPVPFDVTPGVVTSPTTEPPAENPPPATPIEEPPPTTG